MNRVVHNSRNCTCGFSAVFFTVCTVKARLCCTTVRTTLSMTESEAPQTGMSTTLSMNRNCEPKPLSGPSAPVVAQQRARKKCTCGSTGSLHGLHCPPVAPPPAWRGGQHEKVELDKRASHRGRGGGGLLLCCCWLLLVGCGCGCGCGGGGGGGSGGGGADPVCNDACLSMTTHEMHLIMGAVSLWTRPPALYLCTGPPVPLYRALKIHPATHQKSAPRPCR